MIALSTTLGALPTHASASREIAIARSLMSLLEECVAMGVVQSAADLAEQLTDHLRRIDARTSVK